MLVNPLVSVEIGGVEVEMLFTPYLYVVAKERGIEIKVGGESDNLESIRTFVKIMYAAHLNAISIRRYEGGDQKELSLMEFEVWSMTHQKEFGETMKKAVASITGGKSEDVKKKK